MKIIKDHKQLRMVCPDDVCLLEEQEAPLSEVYLDGRPSAWLNIFCPQRSCELTSHSQLP